MEPLRLVQLTNRLRRVALVQEPDLVLLENVQSVYDLALEAIERSIGLADLIEIHLSGVRIPYNEVYEMKSSWRLLPAFDHPRNPFGCLVSGTGLTHHSSALNRQMMHAPGSEKPTDSMLMYRWGVEKGSPADGEVGIQPEWFYKGNGFSLRAHGEALEVPSFADDGGEEPEVAAAYIVDKTGTPWRVGLCPGNEFSDHVMEKKNYLYLAPSKLRQCAIGPELVITPDFSALSGKVSIEKGGKPFWEAEIRSGENHMAHNLRNLEHHHFKYAAHRIPLQAHIHFLGADSFSFGNQVVLEDSDIMQVYWEGLGRPLRNHLKSESTSEKLQCVNVLK